MRKIWLLLVFFLPWVGEPKKKVEIYAHFSEKEKGYSTKDSVSLFPYLSKELQPLQIEVIQKDLKEDQKYLKPISPYSLKGLKSWLKPTQKVPFSEEVLCKVFFHIPSHYEMLDFSRYPKEKLILFLWDPPSEEPHCYQPEFWNCFSRIYTWDDRLVDNKKFFKFFYPYLQKPVSSYPSFKEKKLCVFLSSSFSLEREKAEQLTRYHPEDFDFYEDREQKKESLPQRLKQYRFCICCEKELEEGYFTDKIFHCFSAKCVPIYRGNINITAYIPKECFIDKHSFASYEELYAYLKAMPEEEYLSYLRAIENFLNSPKAALFTKEQFAQSFAQAIQELDPT